jgi:hypothetical protein
LIRRFDHRLFSDGHALRQDGPRQFEFERLLEGPVGHRVPFLFFSQNDTAFPLDLLFEKQGPLGIILEYLKGVLDMGRISLGQAQVIDRMKKRGARIHVRTEIHADGLKIGDQFSRRKMFGTVEQHVLQKMGDPLFLIGFMGRTRKNVQIDADPVPGCGVFHEHILKPVG